MTTDRSVDAAAVLRAEASGDVDTLVTVARTSTGGAVTALGALHRLGSLDDELVSGALASRDRRVRLRAVELSVDYPSIDLLDALRDADDLVVETAAWALGERDHARTADVDALIEIATTHEVSICREAAVAALGAIGNPRGLPAILAGMNDRATVRRRAVLALSPFDTPEVTAALQAALTDRDRQVRQAAEDLVAAEPPPTVA